MSKLNDILSAFKAKVDGLKELAKKDLAQIWAENKLYFILFGAIIAVIKYREVLIDLLVKSGKETYDNAAKKSDSLKKEEDSANDKANELIDKANELSNDKSDVSQDWYKDKK